MHVTLVLLILTATVGEQAQTPNEDLNLVERVTRPDRFDAYRPNYFLFGDNEDQVLFQFSFRYDLWPSEGPFSAYLAYTQRSFWDLYDFDGSSPFTENNYSPELVFRYRFTEYVLGEGFDQFQFGWQHQSNGRDSTESRSWDRVYLEQRYVKYFGPASLSTPSLRAFLHLWLIVAEDPFNDDIEDFAGPGELIVNLSSGDTSVGVFEAELLARKGGYNLSVERGAVQLGLRWKPPWAKWVEFTPGVYVQAFFGHLQSLERYNVRDDAIRVGLYLDS
ncbi:MAG: phospholipase A [Myxococcota bacterium]